MRALRIAGLALEGLWRTRVRVTLTTLGVTIASAAMVSMMAIAVGVQQQVETPFRALGLLNQIQVKPKNGGTNVPLDDDAIFRIGKVPGVAVAYPDVHLRELTVIHGEKHATAIAVAVPREAGLFGVADEILIAGRFFDQRNEPEAIVGTQLVSGLGFASPKDILGTVVTIEATGLVQANGPAFTVQGKRIGVMVVGVYEAPALPLLPMVARSGIFLPVELMKDLPGSQLETLLGHWKTSYNAVTVRVRDPLVLNSVEKQLQVMGYQTRTVLSRLEGMRMFFLAIQVLLAVVGSVAMLIAALGIVNTLLMSVLERYQEIGVCKAVGASDGNLFVLFLTEAASIGLLGGLSGLGLGWALSVGLEAAASAFAHNHGIEGHIDLFAFPPWLLAATVGFAVVVSILAGIYPALRAARVDPICALRSH